MIFTRISLPETFPSGAAFPIFFIWISVFASYFSNQVTTEGSVTQGPG